MKAKLERTTPEERKALMNKVSEMIKDKQAFQDYNIAELKANYHNVKRINSVKYNVRNLFIEMNILDLYVFYANATSDRKQFHFKNENYKKLINSFGLK